MKRPRGNKSSKLTIAACQERLVQLVKHGLPLGEIEEILSDEGFPADKNTLRRDFDSLTAPLNSSNQRGYKTYREKVLAGLEKDLGDLQRNPNMTEAQKLAAKLQVLDRVIKITRMDQPEERDPRDDMQKVGKWHLFLRETKYIETDEDWSRIWAAVREIAFPAEAWARRPFNEINFPECFPPDDPEPKLEQQQKRLTADKSEDPDHDS